MGFVSSIIHEKSTHIVSAKKILGKRNFLFFFGG